MQPLFTFRGLANELRSMPFEGHVIFTLSGAYLLALIALLPALLLSINPPSKER